MSSRLVVSAVAVAVVAVTTKAHAQRDNKTVTNAAAEEVRSLLTLISHPCER